MSVVGICMAKDEADIIGTTVAHMVGQVDYVIVADNLSTDGTGEIAREAGAHVVTDPELSFRQSEKTTALARTAHALYGAEFVVPFDADEVWSSPFGTVRQVLEGLAPQWLCARATLWDYVATAVDPDEPDPVQRIQWRRDTPAPLPKVACRWRDDLVIEQGNHAATYRGGATQFPGLLNVRHFPYRSRQQMERKVRNGAAAYAADPEIPADLGAHWRQWGALLETGGTQVIGDIFYKWYWRERPEESITIEGDDQPPLVFDPALPVTPPPELDESGD